MKFLLIPLILPLVFFSNQSFAQAQNATAVSSAGAGALVRIDGGSSTSNTSNVGGTVVNQGINNSASTNFPGRAQQGDIVCEVPVFEVSAAMTNPGNGFSMNQAIIATFRTPLNSLAQRNCEERSSVALQQSRLDTTINLIKVCQDFENSGIVLNENAPEELLAACNMVN
jgi:hypothetical protein